MRTLTVVAALLLSAHHTPSNPDPTSIILRHCPHHQIGLSGICISMPNGLDRRDQYAACPYSPSANFPSPHHFTRLPNPHNVKKVAKSNQITNLNIFLSTKQHAVSPNQPKKQNHYFQKLRSDMVQHHNTTDIVHHNFTKTYYIVFHTHCVLHKEGKVLLCMDDSRY